MALLVFLTLRAAASGPPGVDPLPAAPAAQDAPPVDDDPQTAGAADLLSALTRTSHAIVHVRVTESTFEPLIVFEDHASLVQQVAPELQPNHHRWILRGEVVASWAGPALHGEIEIGFPMPAGVPGGDLLGDQVLALRHDRWQSANRTLVLDWLAYPATWEPTAANRNLVEQARRTVPEPLCVDPDAQFACESAWELLRGSTAENCEARRRAAEARQRPGSDDPIALESAALGLERPDGPFDPTGTEDDPDLSFRWRLLRALYRGDTVALKALLDVAEARARLPADALHAYRSAAALLGRPLPAVARARVPRCEARAACVVALGDAGTGEHPTRSIRTEADCVAPIVPRPTYVQLRELDPSWSVLRTFGHHTGRLVFVDGVLARLEPTARWSTP